VTEARHSIPRLLERLAAISQAGLAYSTDPYDRERFAELQRVNEELLVALSDGRSLEGLFSEDVGYRTPKVDVRAVVFRGDEILLVREKIDGKWTVPGGWADIGESPAECVARELQEESGYQGRVLRLLALFDCERHGHDPGPWHAYKAFFLCEVNGQPQQTTFETDGVGFFGIDGLPELSTGRVTERQIHTFHDAVQSGTENALFD
jgi:ADP-ribose pyrophosphatase YjhB (NUDIX family)